MKPDPFASSDFEYWTDGTAKQVVETWIKLRIKALESKKRHPTENVILDVLRYELGQL